MSTNLQPRFVTVDDDEMWFLELSMEDLVPNPSMTDLLNEKVFGEHPEKGEFTDMVRIFETSMNRDGDMVQMAGVCGTNIVLCSSFRGTPLASFLEWRAAKSASEPICRCEWDEYMAVKQEEEETKLSLLQRQKTTAESKQFGALDFWESFEEQLVMAMPSVGLDFLFFRREKTFYIHFEFSQNQVLVDQYYQNLRDDPAGLGRWLRRANPIIPRRVWEVMPNGDRVRLNDTLPPGRIIFEGLRRRNLKVVRDQSNDCTTPCEFRSCSMGAGIIKDFDPENGIAIVDMTAGFDKGYCQDPGNPLIRCK